MRTSTIILTALAVAIIAISAPAEAKHHYTAQRYSQPLDVAAVPAYPIEHATAYRQPRQTARHRVERQRVASRGQERELVRPERSYGDGAGRSGSCLNFRATRYLWCGCGAADEVGLDNSDGHWNLAANYFELPRAEPGYNMVAVRYGHVAVLKSHVSGTRWLAYDPNSGGQRAHVHEIDLRSFRAVVDPHGVRRTELSAYRHHPRHHHIRYARR